MRIKYLLTLLWLIFTSSMVGWWWLYGMAHLADPITGIEYLTRKRMLFWEGASFLLAIILGGISLIVVLYNDDKKNTSLKTFFSIFSHDLKTSISRLRLQADVLHENLEFKNNKTLQRLVKDINRLDIQLENSLLLSQLDESKKNSSSNYKIEKFNIVKIVEILKIEFTEFRIQLKKNIEIEFDYKVLLSVFRNLIQNSIIHGNADSIEIDTEFIQKDNKNYIKIRIIDNGQGCSYEFKISNSIMNHGKNTSGIGLYLSKKLLNQLHSEISFSKDPTIKGFEVNLFIPQRGLNV